MQSSRVGRVAITFFVPAEAKSRIRVALSDAGCGTGYQSEMVALLNHLFMQQVRDPLH